MKRTKVGEVIGICGSRDIVVMKIDDDGRPTAVAHLTPADYRARFIDPPSAEQEPFWPDLHGRENSSVKNPPR